MKNRKHSRCNTQGKNARNSGKRLRSPTSHGSIRAPRFHFSFWEKYKCGQKKAKVMNMTSYLSLKSAIRAALKPEAMIVVQEMKDMSVEKIEQIKQRIAERDNIKWKGGV